MITDYLQKKLSTISDKVFFIIIATYQILFTFQGMDFADEGFYATFYQQIFIDPESVSFNFMYWLSGILGGVYFYIFKDLGLWGLRLLGVIVTTSTLIISYYPLKKYISLLNLRIGFVIIILFLSNDPKEMYYNNLSAIFFVTAAILIFNGLKYSNLYLISLSGAIISLAMFTRTPSLTGLIFAISIFYYGCTANTRFSYQIKQAIIFFLGFSLMTLLIILIMRRIGHLEIFTENLKIVFGMGFNSDGQNNIFKLAKSFVYSYSNSITIAFLSINLIIIFHLIINSTHGQKLLSRKYAVSGLILLVILAYIILLLKGKLSYRNMQMLFTGVSLLSAIFILTINSNKELKLLAVLGSLIILFAPFGSEGGQFSVGRYSLWIILPIAVDFFGGINSFSGKMPLTRNHIENSTIHFRLNNEILRKIRFYVLLFFVITCLYYAYFYPYFDLSDRSKMFFQVESELVRGVYTTKERAAAINELLEESKKHIKKNDIILAYDCIPMVHFLTETRPYMRNPWPGYYFPQAFRNELEIAHSKSADLPVIITQKINTIASNWPQNKAMEYKKSKADGIRDSLMNQFIKNNNYHKVWENDAFEIRVPDNGILNN